jgi:hypothetical protein
MSVGYGRSAAHTRRRSPVVLRGNTGWSVYGAPWLQPVATSGKSDPRRSRKDRRKPLPCFATGCRKERMVKRGSISAPTGRRARVRLDRTFVAHVGTGGASAVRADRRRTVSGDVRQKAEYGSVMPILLVRVRLGRAIGWVCKSEVTGSIPVRSIARSSCFAGLLATYRRQLRERVRHGASGPVD